MSSLTKTLQALAFALFFSLSSLLCIAQPANDEACNATTLTVGGACSFTSGTTVAATQSVIFPIPNCGDFASTSHGDVWYSFVIPASGRIAIEMDPGTQTTAGLALYEGVPPAFCLPGPMVPLQECDVNDSPDGDGMPFIIANGMPPGSTVYARIWEPGNNGLGTFSICVTEPSIPGGSPCGTLPDSCSIACDLGMIIPPAYCDGDGNEGTAPSSSFSLTNVGASPSNPYLFMGGCTGNANMSAPGKDVWYKFTATGPVLNVGISAGLSIPTIGLWQGTCAGLVGRGCAVDSTGTMSATFDGLVAMQEYFLQISGGDTNDTGAFTLTLSNTTDCNNCLQEIKLSASPAPIAGVYPPSTTVTFTVEVSEWIRHQQNDLHGLQIIHSAGWDTSTLSTTVPTPCDGSGVWGWYASVTGDSSGLTFGPGYFYDSNSGGSLNGNPGDNYGDLCPGGGLTFSWSITTDTFSCSGPSDLMIEINTTADGESGGWDTLSCTNDQVTTFNAAVSCLLPIDLIYIDAFSEQGGNLVTWAIASELSNDHYIIERSIDGQHFTEAGRIPGGGNSSERSDYSFLDDYVHPGTVWYRVHQIDNNGNGNRTEVVSVHPKGDEAYIHEIYPNPATDKLFVHLVVPVDGKYDINVLDLAGRIVLMKSYSLAIGTYELKHDVSHLSRGQYVLRLKNLTSGLTSIQKFVK